MAINICLQCPHCAVQAPECFLFKEGGQYLILPEALVQDSLELMKMRRISGGKKKVKKQMLVSFWHTVVHSSIRYLVTYIFLFIDEMGISNQRQNPHFMAGM